MKIDFAIVGSGPAGLSAAIEAAKYGVKVAIFDENYLPGGQLFKQIHKFFGSHDHFAGKRGYEIGELLLSEAEKLKVDINLSSTVWGIFKDNILGISDNNGVYDVAAKKILLSTGASEKNITFPGWTLPGVMGAGALQTIMNIHRFLPGDRFIVIGSGNVGLIVAYHILQAGGKILKIIEAAEQIGGWQVHASKIRRCGISIETRKTIKRAIGKNDLEKVELINLDNNFNYIKGTEEVINVDVVCIAVGLSPLNELARIAGCKHIFTSELGGWVPLYNRKYETTIQGVYVAGDLTGIDEATTAMDEGKIVGISVSESLGYINSIEAESKINIILERIRKIHSTPRGSIIEDVRNKIFSYMEKV